MAFILRLKRYGTRNYNTLFHGNTQEFSMHKRTEGAMIGLKPVVFKNKKAVETFATERYRNFSWKPEPAGANP